MSTSIRFSAVTFLVFSLLTTPLLAEPINVGKLLSKKMLIPGKNPPLPDQGVNGTKAVAGKLGGKTGIPGVIPNSVGAAARDALAKPDLICHNLTVNGPVAKTDRGYEVPISLFVQNRGNKAAGTFKIAMNGDAGIDHLRVDLIVPGGDGAYAWMTGGLAAGASTTITGKVLLPNSAAGKDVALRAFVDSTRGDEFPSRDGRVVESNEMNNGSNGQTVSLPFQLNSRVTAPTPSEVGRVSQPESWELHLDRMRINRNDDGNGDDPYFIVIGFRCPIGQRSGAAQTFWNGSLRELGEDHRAGSEFGISDAMGDLRIENVRRMTSYELEHDGYGRGQPLPEVIGWVVVAMESDALPWGEMRDIVERQIRPTLARELDGALSRANYLTTLGDVRGTVAAIKARINSRLTPEFSEAVRLAVVSFADPDDIVNVQTFAYICADDECVATMKRRFGLPETVAVPNLQNIRWDASNPLRFDENTPERLPINDAVRAHSQYDIIWGGITSYRRTTR
jgi:hypothetical protein